MSLVLTTQSEINNFPTDYPGCVILDQTLFIDGTDITNLNGLSALQEIEYLLIKNTNLVDLSGLESLIAVNGPLGIEFNDNLTSLNGLQNLKEVGNLSISGNDILGTISHLTNLDSINGSLSISNNPALISLVGLENCDLVGATNGTPNFSLTISNNDALTSLANLPNPIELNGSLNISFNDDLVNLNAFSNLTKIDNGCNISNNLSLSNLQGLNNLTYCENLSIKNNPSLQNLQGLNNLGQIEFRLDVSDNAGIVDLSGLDGLGSLKTIWIRNNTALANMTGLESISTAEEIWIEENPSLTSMNGLGGLLAVTKNFQIEFNDGLINLMGLENLAQVGTQNTDVFSITGNESLQTLSGLSGLSSLNAIFNIVTNNSLQSLSGLDNLSATKHINLNNNDALKNLDALSNLTTIDNRLQIVNNDSLTTIMDLTSLTSIPTDEFLFAGNAQLSLCHVDIVCQLLEDFPAKIDINNNATGCFDNPEVLSACLTILPVEGLELRASRDHSNQVSLEWETQSESNNSHFTVWRSMNGQNNWSKVDVITSQGNSEQERLYQRSNVEAVYGINYYRVEQTDFNGHHTFSNIVSIQIDANQTIVFPNPGNDRIRVEMSKGSVLNQIQIINLLGEIVFEEFFTNNSLRSYKELSIAKLTPGSYFIIVNQRATPIPLIIQR